ncbi:hypothetical protein [Lysobacter enzymogenes]|uniref:hypothetical protein n=1 Tax=Lysobacter enzymogenes TaxID=69 RepID=UPI0008954426|nr:hypothetical protein [Lysobacter enzymogenes]SDY12946.1 hypothetical protein SAMN05421681_11195 [Lysobacter enzymogenes]
MQPITPPVPQKLQNLLESYPGHIERLQEALDSAVNEPSKTTPPSELAVSALEDLLSKMIDEARAELSAAERSGHVLSAQQADKKLADLGYARFNMGGLPDLYAYFERRT